MIRAGNHVNERILSHGRFNMHPLLCTVDLQWYQDSSQGFNNADNDRSATVGWCAPCSYPTHVIDCIGASVRQPRKEGKNGLVEPLERHGTWTWSRYLNLGNMK
ncbi:hypothetical protein TNCV_1156071 [Trichonephila clavipes]|nr:hypothetical protein TNCV_1156071 [Trichonephila clavipes]